MYVGRSRKHEYAYYFEGRYSRTHSRGHRRRCSKSDSCSPARTKRLQSAKDSPGYEEYKRQKAEAAAWQACRLQAQALALCLEERELQEKAESSQPLANVGPPPTSELAPAPKVAESASHSKLESEHERSPPKNVVPPLPNRAKAKAGLPVSPKQSLVRIRFRCHLCCYLRNFVCVCVCLCLCAASRI